MDKTIELNRELWNFDLRRKETWWITKNLETMVYNGKYYDDMP